MGSEILRELSEGGGENGAVVHALESGFVGDGGNGLGETLGDLAVLEFEGAQDCGSHGLQLAFKSALGDAL